MSLVYPVYFLPRHHKIVTTLLHALMPTLRPSALRIIALLLAATTLCACPAAIRKPRLRDRADRYYKAGEYEKAKIEYLNLLRLDPQNVAVYQQLGLIWFDEGAPLRAIPFFLKVRELAPNNLEARLKLALGFMALSGFSEARKEALAILDQDPGNADAIVLLADTGQTQEDNLVTEQRLQKLPKRDSSGFHLASASLALRKKEIGNAAEHLQQALALDPKAPQLHLAMAYVYLLRKDSTRAAEEFKAAADLSPLRSGNRIKYAEFKAANGAASEAKSFLQSLTQQAPDYLPAWNTLARLALTEKKYDESLALLENIFSRDPDNPDARILQSEALLAKGNSAEAVAVLDKLNKAYPKNPLLKYQLARAYVSSKNPGQATVVLQEAIAAKPDYAEAILALSELNLRSGKAQAVVAPLEELLKKRPDLLQTRLLLATAYQILGRMNDAAALFREQIKSAPESPEPYYLLGIILRQQKKTDEARQAFEKAAELVPNNLGPLDQLLGMDLTEKRYDVAMQRAQEQLAKKPGQAYPHFMEARVRAAQGDWTGAEAALKKATELDPNFAAAYNLLVSVYVAANKLPQAISGLEAILEKNPKDVGAVTMTGFVYEKMLNYPKACGAYEKLLALNPDSVVALNNLAYLYAEQLNQVDKAYELAQKARQLQPADRAIADTLGWILYKRGDYQQALALMQESAGKLVDDPEVQFHLGMTYYMMGQGAAARAAFQQAALATVDFPDKAEVQRRLAQLEEPSGQAAGELPLSELEARLQQEPNDPLLLSRLAEAYERQGQAAKAAANYERALKLNPKLPGVVLKLAQLYAGPLKDQDKALDFAKKARELAPNDARVAGLLGRIAFQAGNFSWAYSLLQESARQQPNDAGTLYDLALVAYALGKAPEARKTMQRALDAAPTGAQSEEAKRFLAMTGLDELSPQGIAAEGEVQKILQTQPDYVPALMAQAAIHLQRSDAKAAVTIYLEVLQKYPDFAPAQKRLAAIYAERPEDVAKAYDLAMKARKTLADDPGLARTLAEISFTRKEFPYAIQLFEQSAAQQPLPAKDLYFLGMAQLQTRQDAKGRETLGRALAAGLQDPFAQEARHRLNEQHK